MATKKCYYELLNIQENATGDEIKVAYRKMALIWHPDKNRHREEEAKEAFQNIQEAYSILSDPNERAWYDSHKDQILNQNNDSYSNTVNVFAYFQSTCFHGFDEKVHGNFYSVYDKIFNEVLVNETTKGTMKQTVLLTRFGNSETPISQVLAFYSFFGSFTTTVTMSEADEYKPGKEDGRRMKRAMDQENKKLRSKAQKEYSDSIRHLSTVVNKRDPRIRVYMSEQSRLATEKREKEEKEKEEREQREKEKREEKKRLIAEQYEAEKEERRLAREHAKLEGQVFLYESEGEEEETIDVFNCAVCKKTYKTEKQWQEHEKSKKHVQNVKALRQHLIAEEKLARKMAGVSVKEKEVPADE